MDARSMNRAQALNRLIKLGVHLSLRVFASLARSRLTAPATSRLLAGLGRFVADRRGVTPAESPREVAEAWQLAFPSKKQVPITAFDDAKAHAEIHTPCPLRGSGDLGACHRMMAYDRAFVARAGGRFVVLESQAEPGVSRCRVAMRLEGASMNDLVDVGER